MTKGAHGKEYANQRWERIYVSFYAGQVKSMEIMVEFVLAFLAFTIITLRYGKKGISFFRS